MNKQSGFTLIELVMVIVILGVLSVTALPKFINLKGDAQKAALDGVAGSLGAAASMNYAAKKAGNAAGVSLTNCTGVMALLTASPGTNYTITAQAIATDVTATCVVTDTNNNAISSTFLATGV